MSINFFGLDHDFSGVGCCTTDFDSEFVVEKYVRCPLFFTDGFVFNLWHFVKLLPWDADFTDAFDFVFEFFCGETVAEL